MGLFTKLFNKNIDQFYAPIKGRAIPLGEVSDPAFSEGMLGNGIAIIPAEGKVYAPCDATVVTMFDTGHAVSLKADCGAEILIHVGLETVSMGGKPFTVHTASGNRVQKGQLLMEADLEAIQAAGLSVTTPVIICNTPDYSVFHTHTGMDVTNDTVIIELAK